MAHLARLTDLHSERHRRRRTARLAERRDHDTAKRVEAPASRNANAHKPQIDHSDEQLENAATRHILTATLQKKCAPAPPLPPTLERDLHTGVSSGQKRARNKKTRKNTAPLHSQPIHHATMSDAADITRPPVATPK